MIPLNAESNLNRHIIGTNPREYIQRWCSGVCSITPSRKPCPRYNSSLNDCTISLHSPIYICCENHINFLQNSFGILHTCSPLGPISSLQCLATFARKRRRVHSVSLLGTGSNDIRSLRASACFFLSVIPVELQLKLNNKNKV